MWENNPQILTNLLSKTLSHQPVVKVTILAHSVVEYGSILKQFETYIGLSLLLGNSAA